MSARHACFSGSIGCRITLAALLMLCPLSFAGEEGAAHTSLCTPAETTVFSCEVRNHKLVSLCASPDLSHDTGYLQYRFGHDAHSIEMEFPHSTSRQAATFKYLQEYFARGGTTALSFWVGPFRYSVFRTTSAFGFNGAGVIVSKGHRRVAYLRCDDKSIVTDDDRLAQLPGLGLPEANGDISYIGAEQ